MNEAQILGSSIAALIGGWVIYDASKRGKNGTAALLWGLGVFLALIVFLPLYLYMRSQEQKNGIKQSASKQTTTCRYCGTSFEGDPAYCPQCQKQLKSSEEIHSTLR